MRTLSLGLLSLGLGALDNVFANNAFDRVIEALENAENDARAAQKANDDEFTKVQCLAQELIDEANAKIPVAKETISETTAKIAELRSENEALSIEATDLDATVARLTKELAAKQQKRDEDNAKYVTDSTDMTRGVEMMDAAIKVGSRGGRGERGGCIRRGGRRLCGKNKFRMMCCRCDFFRMIRYPHLENSPYGLEGWKWGDERGSGDWILLWSVADAKTCCRAR